MMNSIEQKIEDAYRILMHANTINNLRAQGVPESALSGTAEGIIVAAARAHAADLRERLPRDMRTAYLDRRHWLPAPCPLSELEAAVQTASTARAAELMAQMTVEDIVEALQGMELLLTNEG